MFGLYPRKGTIAPGSDADVVVYDPNATQVLSAATHHMNVDYSCYEGKEITGRVRHRAVARPDVIVDGGEYRGAAGHGRFLSATRASTWCDSAWTSGSCCRPTRPARRSST